MSKYIARYGSDGYFLRKNPEGQKLMKLAKNEAKLPALELIKLVRGED